MAKQEAEKQMELEGQLNIPEGVDMEVPFDEDSKPAAGQTDEEAPVRRRRRRRTE